MAEGAPDSAAAVAFDRVTPEYDARFGPNPVGRLFRYLFQERLLRLFPAGARVLDLGCGTGEDALFLAARGRAVVGLDVAPGMVARARARAEAEGVDRDRLRFECAPAEAAGSAVGPFDGAYSDFGALNCADLRATGRGLARALRPGAGLLLSVMGPSPLPLLLRLVLTGRGEPRGRRDPRVAGIAVPTAYPSRAELRRAFGPEFSWSGGFALGVLLPGPDHSGWAARHPQAFGLLAGLESLARAWPLLRGLGDHNVLEGRRR